MQTVETWSGTSLSAYNNNNNNNNNNSNIDINDISHRIRLKLLSPIFLKDSQFFFSEEEFKSLLFIYLSIYLFIRLFIYL